MSLIELKYALFEKIRLLEDESYLQYLHDLLDKKSPSKDDVLSPEQLASIKKSQEQWEKGAYISGEEMIQNGKQLLETLQKETNNEQG